MAALLYATENDYETADGKIAIFDARSDFARIGEFNSGGIDPHEMMLMDSDVICVANGGIETPSRLRGREKSSTSRPCSPISLSSTG